MNNMLLKWCICKTRFSEQNGEMIMEEKITSHFSLWKQKNRNLLSVMSIF